MYHVYLNRRSTRLAFSTLLSAPKSSWATDFAKFVTMKMDEDTVARMWRLYNAGIGLTTGFIGSHTVTHNYSVYTLQLAVHYSTCRVFLLLSSLVARLPTP
jgi:hypothetical protein